MIKPLNKLSLEGTFLVIIKATNDRPTAKMVLDGERLEVFFPFKVGSKRRVSTLAIFIQRYLEPSGKT